jgi:hypothetical protein
VDKLASILNSLHATCPLCYRREIVGTAEVKLGIIAILLFLSRLLRGARGKHLFQHTEIIGSFLYSVDIEIVELAMDVLVAASKSSSSIISGLSSDQTEGIEVKNVIWWSCC